MKWRIEANGLFMGEYEAEDRDGALDAYAIDAGYESYAEVEELAPAKGGVLAQPVTDAIKDVLDRVDVFVDDKAVTDYATCFLCVTQELGGTLPEPRDRVAYERVPRGYVHRLWSEHKATLQDLFDKACSGPIEI